MNTKNRLASSNSDGARMESIYPVGRKVNRSEDSNVIDNIGAGISAGGILLVWQQPDSWFKVLVTIIGTLIIIQFIMRLSYPWVMKLHRRFGQVSTTPPLQETEFRARPYEEHHENVYDLPNNAHRDAIRWLKESKQPFLYLTGYSGTGKSSLLKACLIPNLRDSEHPIDFLEVPCSADPLKQLEDHLRGLPAGQHNQAGKEADLHALLEQKAEYAATKKKRLVVVIDQFEICQLFADDRTKTRLKRFFLSLQAKRIDNLQLLLIMSAEDKMFILCDEFGLPKLSLTGSDANWFDLDGLSPADARRRLEQCDSKLGDDTSKILEEITENKDGKGIVRLVKLNMAARQQKSYSDYEIKQKTTGGLIEGYLRTAMREGGVQEIAPLLLQRMIKDSGPIPMSENDLAAATGSDLLKTQRVLHLLEVKGIVRSLDPELATWAVSHDFIATALDNILPNFIAETLDSALPDSKQRRWQSIQNTAKPLTVAASILLVLLIFASYIPWKELKIADERSTQDMEIADVPPKEERRTADEFPMEGAKVIDAPPKGEETNIEAFPRQEGEIVEELLELGVEVQDNQDEGFEIRIDESTDVAQIDRIFKRLGSIDPVKLVLIKTDGLRSLPVLDGFSKLQKLIIIDNVELRELPSLNGLTDLRYLLVRGNQQLQSVPPLDDLADLKSLEIAENNALLNLPPFNALQNLEQIEISRNPKLEKIPSLNDAIKLKEVRVFENDNVDGLDLPESGHLKIVYYDATNIAASIEVLKGVPDDVKIEVKSRDIHQGFEQELNRARSAIGRGAVKVRPSE